MSTPYTELLAGTQEVSTTLVPVNAAQGTIAALTPLMFNANLKAYHVWDKSPGTAIYLTASSVETGDGRTLAQVYKTGIFNIDAINWPEELLTSDDKLTAFSGVGISVQPLNG
ncbi:head decoration protein [Salmonella enterica subsp. salamae]|nr:head decoration protein [Salmonella enterica subsp. salamae]